MNIVETHTATPWGYVTLNPNAPRFEEIKEQLKTAGYLFDPETQIWRGVEQVAVQLIEAALVRSVSQPRMEGDTLYWFANDDCLNVGGFLFVFKAKDADAAAFKADKLAKELLPAVKETRAVALETEGFYYAEFKDVLYGQLSDWQK